MKKIVMMLAAVAAMVVLAKDAPDPARAEECRVRKGLPNVFAKLKAGEQVTVAYLGGSITEAGKGWRPQSMEWFRKTFPNAKVRELHAAISGTDSKFGATRFAADVLGKGTPDLLFIEFRVNGGSKDSVEGIIRQMWKANPRADICLVYTICDWMINDLRKGRHSPFCTEMEELANHYGIPSVDFGLEIVKRLDAGELVFKAAGEVSGKLVFTRDGVHPLRAGHAIYCETLARSLMKMDVGAPFAHSLGKAVTEIPWERAELVPAARFLTDNPDWKEIDYANDPVYRASFGRTQQMLRGGKYTEREGATFTVEWEGTHLLFSDIPQDKEMVVEVSIDGGEPIVRKRNRSSEPVLYSRFWSVRAEKAGCHTAVVTVKKIPSGQRFFCGQLQVLGHFIPPPAPVAEKIDPRVRSWVEPTRIVWKSKQGVADADALLKPKRGQIPERIWLNGDGCLLTTTNGATAGVLLDFGRELHGGLQIGCGGRGGKGMKLRVRFGESVGEAMSEFGEKGSQNDHAIRDSVIDVPWLGSREIGMTGFRFVRIDLITEGKVSLDFVRAVSLMRPMARLGDFKSSDARLNAVWETAVRTVHLCAQEHLWDGIKRDRLVWMGDTHPETRSLLAVFGAGATVLPESFDYIEEVTPMGEWMNTFPCYTMWYIRNVRDWWFATGDRAWLVKHREYLKGTLNNLMAQVTKENRLRADLYKFLDWPTERNRPAVEAGSHGLMIMAMRDGAEIMRELGEKEMAERCSATAARMATVRPDAKGTKSAAALLALSGVRSPREMFETVLGKNGVNGVSTFYGYYMIEAMSAAGENQRALDTVRDYWGAMLDVGATSFWEDFHISWTNNCSRIDELPVAGKKDIHGDYGDFCYVGFRHSLCHGWSSGPAAWCINRVLGLEPVAPGSKVVRVKPFLGDLDWAEGAIATPFGPVRVRHDKQPDGTIKTTMLSVPPEVCIER